jgi:hypothetical protein
VTVAALATLLALTGTTHAAEQEPGTVILGRWLFNEGQGSVAADGVDGAGDGEVVNALWTEGKEGGALAFEDYSLIDYLKPDVSKATRVVVPHLDRLNPSGPFTLRATIYATRDPIYYGGIVEKGRGFGASYRLLLLRGLRIRATLGGSQGTVTSKDPLTLNQWHQVEVVYDGSDLTLKIDGQEQARLEGVKGNLASTDDLLMGERLSGRIDAVELRTP